MGRLREVGERSAAVAKRVAGSQGGQAARQQAGTALQGGVEAARRRAAHAAPRAGDSAQAKRVGEVVRRTTHVGGTGATRAVAAGRRAIRGADGRPGTGTVAWLALGLATLVATFLSWLVVDMGDSGAALDIPVPTSLLEALERGYSMQDVAGLGFALTALTLGALGAGGLGFVLRRWYLWAAAAMLQLVALGVAAVGLLAAVGAGAARDWLVPADWAPYAPDVTVGIASAAYLGAGCGFMLASIAIAVGSRRRRSRATCAAVR